MDSEPPAIPRARKLWTQTTFVTKKQEDGIRDRRGEVHDAHVARVSGKATAPGGRVPRDVETGPREDPSKDAEPEPGKGHVARLESDKATALPGRVLENPLGSLGDKDARQAVFPI